MDTTMLSNPVVKSFFAGSVAAAMTMPVVSQESGAAINSNIFNIVRNIIRNDSIAGLWKGSSPSFYRCVPGVGTYFSSLHWLKSKYFKDRKPTGLESMLLGAGARTFTTICTLPMTVVKTRFESGQFNYRTISEALWNINEKEGVRGLYRGISATLVRDAPFSGIYLMLYTTTKGLVEDGGAMYNFGCGVVSGASASIITQPADVIKTSMQLDQSSPKMMKVIVHIYKEHGLAGYFRGITPRIARRTLMAAMAWTVYEQVSKLLNNL